MLTKNADGMNISIHAPSRERPYNLIYNEWFRDEFQSTLPHGSDQKADLRIIMIIYFNPRSLTGATQHQNKILLHSFKSSIYCELAQFKSLKILF